MDQVNNNNGVDYFNDVAHNLHAIASSQGLLCIDFHGCTDSNRQ